MSSAAMRSHDDPLNSATTSVSRPKNVRGEASQLKDSVATATRGCVLRRGHSVSMPSRVILRSPKTGKGR